MRLELFVPIRTVAGLNAREHYMARAKRVKKERQTAHLLAKFPAARLKRFTQEAGLDWPQLYPLQITLTRVKPRGPELDEDNLQGAAKAARDGIADALGINDGDKAVALWDYAQEKGPWGIKVVITTRDEAAGLSSKPA